MNPGLSGEAAAGGVSQRVCRALAGMDVGLAAGLAALSWLSLHSWLRGEFWWAKLNVAGAVFYGPEVYTMGLSRATAAGFALLLVVYTALGLSFSLVARTEGYARNLMLALGWSAVWQLAAQRWFWPRLDAFGASYYPPLATLPAHLMMALCLARYAVRYRSLAAAFGDPAWSAALAEEAASGVEQGPEEESRPVGEEQPAVAAAVVEEAAGGGNPEHPEGAGTPQGTQFEEAQEPPARLLEAAPEGEESLRAGEAGASGGAGTEGQREAVGGEDEKADC